MRSTEDLVMQDARRVGTHQCVCLVFPPPPLPQPLWSSSLASPHGCGCGGGACTGVSCGAVRNTAIGRLAYHMLVS